MSEATQNLANAQELFESGEAKRRHKRVTLPVSGHNVRIQSLTEREKSTWEANTLSSKGNLKVSKLEDANRRLIVLCLVDGAGNRIANQTHMAAIAGWDSADSAHLYKECADHTGVNTDDVEEMVKNSETITVEGSPSPLPNEPE